MNQLENKKFVILGLPRTGTCALRHSLIDSGLSVCPGEPFFAEEFKNFTSIHRHNHLKYSGEIFKDYDGFKIIVGHSEQVLDICAQNNAKLILTRRHNFLSFMASYYVLVTGQHKRTGKNTGSNSESYSTWTSTGNEVIYKPLPFMNYVVDRFLYYNYLIDNVYNKHENYLTTIDFEDVTKGVSDLENHFDIPINLNITSNTLLSKYFINHEEFRLDVENRMKIILGNE